MPKHYSADLRWRAVWLVLLHKMTYEEVGDILFMSERSVRRYVARAPAAYTHSTHVRTIFTTAITY